MIDSADIYFGTVAMRIVDALIRRAKRIAEFFVTLEQEGPDWVLMYLERPSFQFEEEWFLTNVDQHEYGPYPSQACAHDAGLLLLDDAKDMYREIPKAECRAEIEKSWSHEGEKVIRLREKGYTDREILCALEMGGERLPVKFS